MQDLNEFGRFVKNLKNLQLDKKRLAIHIDLLQSITSVSSRRAFLSQWQSEQAMIERGQTDYDMLEDAIAEEVPLVKLLRMLCLQSLCCGGFKKFDQFRREILQTYGYEYVFTLDNLEKLGFFRKSGIWDWPAIRRAFRLVVDNPDVNKPVDMSYVTSGYAPLSTRIVEMFCKKGWEAMHRSLDLLPGTAASVRQDPFSGSGAGTSGAASGSGAVLEEQKVLNVANGDADGADEGGGGPKKLLLVYFLGGVTHMEVGACCSLSAPRHRILIATTNICNGNSLLGRCDRR